jgi:hypothetical protein
MDSRTGEAAVLNHGKEGRQIIDEGLASDAFHHCSARNV